MAIEWLGEQRQSLAASSFARDEAYLRLHVLPAFGEVPLASVRRSDIRFWVAALSDEGLAAATVKECHRILSAILKLAVEEKLISENPCRGIKLPRPEDRQIRFINESQVEDLVSCMDVRYRVMVYLTAYLGLRWGEVVGLRHGDVDVDRFRLRVVGVLEDVGGRVRYKQSPKTDSARRTLTLPPFLQEMLASHLLENPDTPYVFVSPEGAPLRRSAFRARLWVPAVDRAGLKGLHFHDLRHTAASIAHEYGAGLFDIKELLGHKDIQTTANLYMHLQENSQRASAAQEQAFRSASEGRKGRILDAVVTSSGDREDVAGPDERPQPAVSPGREGGT